MPDNKSIETTHVNPLLLNARSYYKHESVVDVSYLPPEIKTLHMVLRRLSVKIPINVQIFLEKTSVSFRSNTPTQYVAHLPFKAVGDFGHYIFEVSGILPVEFNPNFVKVGPRLRYADDLTMTVEVFGCVKYNYVFDGHLHQEYHRKIFDLLIPLITHEVYRALLLPKVSVE